MRYRLALLLLAASAALSCTDPKTASDQRLNDHIRACEGRGAYIVASQPCEEAKKALLVLVKTDPDCLAYFGSGDAAAVLECPK